MNDYYPTLEINKKQFYNSGELGLPKSPRTYLDGFADEYGELTTEEKLAHLGFLLKRGFDIYPVFKSDIDNHIAQPSYGNYEMWAKSSILTYISYLRTGKDEIDDNLYFLKSKPFKKLTSLLEEEIRYRYWEKEIESSSNIACNFDAAYYDFEKIKLRYVSRNGAFGQKQFEKYLLTSKETLQKIDIDKERLIAKNGWASLEKELFGYDVYSDTKQHIYPGDKNIIQKYNEKAEEILAKGGRDTKFILGVPPEPFLGNILSAKVVILSLNPGYNEEINHIACMKLSQGEKEGLLALKRSSLLFKADGIFDCYKSSRLQGGKYNGKPAYWEQQLKNLSKDVYDVDPEIIGNPIYKEVGILQYIGYHSNKIGYLTKEEKLPSMQFTELIVKYLINCTDNLLVILRSESLWKNIIGEKSWEQWIGKRIITKGHNGMCQAISRGNIKDDGYEKIVKHLEKV